MIEGRAIYTQARTRFQQGIIGTKGLREARNCYYRIIRREKRECWEAFLQGAGLTLPEGPDISLGKEDIARCWLALRYTKPRNQEATPSLHRGGRETPAVTFNNKEVLVREAAFPPAPEEAPIQLPPLGRAHEEATEQMVKAALFSQAVTKAPGVDRLRFRALRLL